MAQVQEEAPPATPAEQSPTLKQIERLKKVSDENLRYYLSDATGEEWDKFVRLVNGGAGQETSESPRVFELGLVEVVRRGGPAWEPCLKSMYDQVMELARDKAVNALETPTDPIGLEVLTALRRVQKKPDPLQIQVSGELELTTEFPDLPAFKVALRNADEEKQPVCIQAGGNYLSGRPGRWRFEVRRADGSYVPIKQTWGQLGGISSYQTLNHGETWSTVLPMQRFLEIGVPGTYEVRIQYHDAIYLSNCHDISGMIVHWSKPIKLVVKPRKVSLTQEQLTALQGWIHRLEDAAPIRMIRGQYGPAHHQFITPESPAGSILNLGWKAVPLLVDALSAKGLGANKRAWIFALLYSTTGCLDPTQSHGNVLPSYEWQAGAWQVSSELKGEKDITSLGSSAHGTSTGSKVSEDDQQALATAWLRWKDFVQLEIDQGP